MTLFTSVIDVSQDTGHVPHQGMCSDVSLASEPNIALRDGSARCPEISGQKRPQALLPNLRRVVIIPGPLSVPQRVTGSWYEDEFKATRARHLCGELNTQLR